MVSFVTYDLIFLAVFILAVIVFLKVKKKNVHRQGIAYLYKTDWGIKLMDSFSKKNKSWLGPLQYLVIASGVVLMVAITWLIAESAYLYLKFPITSVTKAPPIAPLIPYFPKIFGLSSFFPPLYFTYFIIAVAIGGVLHEFAHGLFARLNGFKVKSTGFLFVGPLLGAFVEPDEKQMEKAKKKPQLSILAAGTFANVVIAAIVGVIMVLFFSASFVPAGVGFTGYSSVLVNTNTIDVPDEFSLEERVVEVMVDGETFLVNPSLLQRTLDEGREQIILFDDAPAIRSGLPITPSAITEFGGQKISSFGDLAEAVGSKSPGERVNVKVAVRDGLFDVEPEFEEYELELGEREGRPFIGIVADRTGGGNILRNFFAFIFAGAGTLDRFTYYESSVGDFGWFIYFLLWWTFLINVLLALFNMLPLGPLDGGKFFQLSVAGLVGSDRVGKKAFKLATWLIILALVVMMVKWAASFF